MLAQAEDHLAAPLGAITADGGYYSGRNVKYAQEENRDIYIPRPRDSNPLMGQDCFEYDEVGDRFLCPAGQWLKRSSQRRRNGVVQTRYRSSVRQCGSCPLKSACTSGRFRTLAVAETYVDERTLAAKLASSPGQAIYARRRELVEPVFGNIKFNLGFTRFSLRRLANAKGEFLFVCMAHNLKKLAQWRSALNEPLASLLDAIRTILDRLGIAGVTHWIHMGFGAKTAIRHSGA